jgi:hypothetical protein
MYSILPDQCFKLNFPDVLSLVGGPLSGNKRLWFTEIYIYSFCYFFLRVALFTEFILDKLNTGLLNQVKQTKLYFINLSPLLALPRSRPSRTQLTPSTDY